MPGSIQSSWPINSVNRFWVLPESNRKAKIHLTLTVLNASRAMRCELLAKHKHPVIQQNALR